MDPPFVARTPAHASQRRIRARCPGPGVERRKECDCGVGVDRRDPGEAWRGRGTQARSTPDLEGGGDPRRSSGRAAELARSHHRPRRKRFCATRVYVWERRLPLRTPRLAGRPGGTHRRRREEKGDERVASLTVDASRSGRGAIPLLNRAIVGHVCTARLAGQLAQIRGTYRGSREWHRRVPSSGPSRRSPATGPAHRAPGTYRIKATERYNGAGEAGVGFVAAAPAKGQARRSFKGD